MFKKGSKIELIKPMGMLNDIGIVCTIKDTDENGNINFEIPMTKNFLPSVDFGTDWKAFGNMSMDEAAIYFKEHVEKKEVEPFTYFNTDTCRDEITFGWTKWMKREILYYDLEGFLVRLYCKYRYNHRKLELKCISMEYFAELNFGHNSNCYNKEEECQLRTHASCNCKLDNFSVTTGLKLATYRLMSKYRELQYKNYLTTL